MFNVNKLSILLLRSFALVSVVTLGLLSILASGGSGSSSDDDLPLSFANAGPDQNILTQTPTLLDGSGSETPMGANPDGDVPTYFWTVLSTPSQSGSHSYSFENVTAINPRFSPIEEGEYVVQLRVRFRGVSAFDTVSIFGYSNLPPPIAKAGPDQFVKHGRLVTLDASDSYSQFDSNRLPFEYSWFLERQPTGSSSSLSATSLVTPSFIAEFDPSNIQPHQGSYSWYETKLQVTDSDGRVSRPVYVKTRVYPAEGYAYPTPVAGPRQRVVSGSTVQLDGSASFDTDGRSLSYDWQFYARPPGSSATLTGADSATPSFVADQEGVYVVQLQVGNGERSSIRLNANTYDPSDDWGFADYAGNDRVVITALVSASTPVVDAGPNQILTFTGATAIPLDGSGSYSPSGAVITYHWYLISMPVGSSASIDTPDDTEPDTASLLADVAGSYVVGLQGGVNIEHVVITLTENNQPTVMAGNDQAVSAGNTVILNGSSSNDPDGDPLGYSWSLASAPGPWGRGSNGTWMNWPFLSDGMVAEPSFTPDLNGEYRLRLTVNDGELSSVVDEVIITATGSAINTAPTADAGPDQPNAVTGVQVTLDGSGSSDPDTDLITFLWHVESVPPNSMMWDGSLAMPTSEQPVFTPDLEGVYQFSLVVNDGLLDSAADTVNITVTDPVGVCSNPLTLQTSLPYLPGIPETPTIFQIDAAAVDTIRLVSINDPSAATDVSALQGFIPDLNQISEVNFITINGNWTIFSRSHNNPVSDAVSPSFILERQSDNIFFKVDVALTGSVAFAAVQIDSLTACRCGADAGDCP